MIRQGSLVVVSGFSGVGKGTVIDALMKKSDLYAYSVSATTREARKDEQHGREYFFLNEQQFNEMIRDDELIEFACYCDHYYGTPRKFVEEQMRLGKDVILEIETQGAEKIRQQYPDALLIFIMPPSGAELKNRLAGRGSESEQVIRQRLQRAVKESESIEDYTYIFINDDAGQCAEKMHSLIQAQRSRTTRNMPVINAIRSEILAFTKGE